MILTRGKRKLYEPNKRTFQDRRVKKSWAVYSYYDETGVEYRKSFESDPFTKPDDFDNIAPKYLNQ